jgi:hypothetical protein
MDGWSQRKKGDGLLNSAFDTDFCLQYGRLLIPLCLNPWGTIRFPTLANHSVGLDYKYPKI